MKITMAHGSGGNDSKELMREIFGKHFSNDVLDRMEDAAAIDMEFDGKLAISTDSFVVTPLEFKGGDIGKLCVCGTVNDILMMGADPLYITCGFILEEGLDVNLLDRVVESMAAQAKAAGVKIVAGDTKVVEGSGGLMINTTGIGIVPKDRDISAANCKKGDKIIVSGTLGDHHACILSARMEIENEIASDCGCLKDITEALFDAGITVHAMRDVTRGGMGTILNEIAETSCCKIEIEEAAVPVTDAVKGFSGMLGLDPLYMGNEGKMIAIVSGEMADEALALMKNTEHGKDAAIIGEITEECEGDAKPVVHIKTPLGATRVLDVLYGEGLPRIC